MPHTFSLIHLALHIHIFIQFYRAGWFCAYCFVKHFNTAWTISMSIDIFYNWCNIYLVCFYLHYIHTNKMNSHKPINQHKHMIGALSILLTLPVCSCTIFTLNCLFIISKPSLCGCMYFTPCKFVFVEYS